MVIVFQNFNLFPHMTLLENICYAPRKVQKWAQGDVLEIPRRTPALLTFPEEKNSEGALQGRWPWIQRYCCLMSLPQPWIQNK